MTGPHVRAISLNICGGLGSKSGCVEGLLRLSGARVVGLQETREVTADIDAVSSGAAASSLRISAEERQRNIAAVVAKCNFVSYTEQRRNEAGVVVDSGGATLLVHKSLPSLPFAVPMPRDRYAAFAEVAAATIVASGTFNFVVACVYVRPGSKDHAGFNELLGCFPPCTLFLGDMNATVAGIGNPSSKMAAERGRVIHDFVVESGAMLPPPTALTRPHRRRLPDGRVVFDEQCGTSIDLFVVGAGLKRQLTAFDSEAHVWVHGGVPSDHRPLRLDFTMPVATSAAAAPERESNYHNIHKHHNHFICYYNSTYN
jgi:hypothetical protein